MSTPTPGVKSPKIFSYTILPPPTPTLLRLYTRLPNCTFTGVKENPPPSSKPIKVEEKVRGREG